MILGPAHFYEDSSRPVRLRIPLAKQIRAEPPALPPPPSAAAIATLQEASPLHSGPSLHAIMQAACMVTGVRMVDCISAHRERHLVRARQIYFWLARAVTPLSYPLIAKMCGNRDHSTAMYACAKIARRLSEYADDIAAAKKLLGVE